MTTLNIGDKITFTTSTGTHTGIVDGRNWSFDTLHSYIVYFDGITIPVCPKTFKSQLAV